MAGVRQLALSPAWKNVSTPVTPRRTDQGHAEGGYAEGGHAEGGHAEGGHADEAFGSFLDSKCLLQHGYPLPLGTSFYPVAVAQLPRGLNATWLPEALRRARQAVRYMERTAAHLDGDGDGVAEQLFYNSSAGMAIQVSGPSGRVCGVSFVKASVLSSVPSVGASPP